MLHTLPGRSRALALAAMAVLLTLLGVALVATPAVATPGDQVCGPLSSGKIDTTGDPQTVTATAPAGQLITGYCVKAGSANQGDGPVYVTLTTPVASITFGHPSGKAVSHYSYSLTTAPTPTSVQVAPTLEDVCGPGYELVVPAPGAGYAFATDASGAPGGVGTIIVTATLAQGYVWSDGTTAPKTWSFGVTNEPCVQVSPEPTAPTFQDVCGPEYELTVPADSATFAYATDASGVVGGAGTVVVSATPGQGFTWADGTTAPRTWSYVATNEPCILEDPEPEPPTVEDLCGEAYALTVPSDTEDHVYAVDESGVVDGAGTIVVTATRVGESDRRAEGAEPWSWTLAVTDDDCVVEEEIAPPDFLEVCGPDGEAPYELPAAGAHHAYAVSDPGIYVDGHRTIVVTAVLDEGWVAPEGATTEWSATLDDEPCEESIPDRATAAIVVTPATCTADGTVSTGAVEHATWLPAGESLPVDDAAPAAARSSAPEAVADVPGIGEASTPAAEGSGAVVLVAVADEGAAFDTSLPGVSEDGRTRTFTATPESADPALCPTIQPESGERPEHPAPRAHAPAPRVHEAAALPRTGSDPTGALLLGALLLALGCWRTLRRRPVR